MVDGGGGTSFPVVFYDGEREINIGDICVHPMLQFKVFQKMISDMIGISPNQISIYIVPHSSSPEDRRRIPITGKVNFSLIIGQRDCFFLVILKRSRKSRYQRLRPSGMDYGDFVPDSEFLPPPPPPPPLENVVLLRRNQPELNLMGLPMNGYSKPFQEQVTQLQLSGLNDRLQNLKLQREMYGMAMAKPVSFKGPSPDLGRNLDPYSFRMIDETMTKNARETGSEKVVCVECLNAAESGGAARFHACVKDPPIERFKTRAGPIARPAKP